MPSASVDPIRFTPPALADWHFLASARIIGAPLQYSELLARGLTKLRHGRPARLSLTQLATDGFVWEQHNLRWVIRATDNWERVFVHGIVREAFDPFRKLWRYFNQFKAVDLLRRSELYLCRLDHLEADPFEGRPTQPMLDQLVAVSRSVFGENAPDPRLHFENQRRATYACCWQKLEVESAEMWRDYCNDDGGLAIQSTERRLQHQFALMQVGQRLLYFREVDYIDHEAHSPESHGFPEQAFLKRRRYAEERETRFARFVPDVFCGTQTEIERALAGLPTGQRVPFDLSAATETVVINPRASGSDRKELLDLIATNQPFLASRVRNSALPP
ncbi:MAG: hypothetical protein Q8J74_01575 [Candidatus Didemnitutus sp.]|nr:hypothetical protein [Candidatus Didemnitutus sp.]